MAGAHMTPEEARAWDEERALLFALRDWAFGPADEEGLRRALGLDDDVRLGSGGPPEAGAEGGPAQAGPSQAAPAP